MFVIDVCVLNPPYNIDVSKWYIYIVYLKYISRLARYY